MKPTNPEDIRWETDDLNERVMEDASPSTGAKLDTAAPEVPVSDDPPVSIKPRDSTEDEESISELLVNAGIEEAALEQRVSADHLPDDSDQG